MTELEAYQMLGWRPDLDRIMSGTYLYRVDWLVVRCSVCSYRGLTVPELVSYDCIGCGNKNLIYEEPE